MKSGQSEVECWPNVAKACTCLYMTNIVLSCVVSTKLQGLYYCEANLMSHSRIYYGNLILESEDQIDYVSHRKSEIK